MKKIVAIIVAIVLGIGVFSVYETEAALATGTPFEIDGKLYVGPEDEPAPYINKDRRTMVPLRFFAEALGVPNDEEHIGWNQDTQTATIMKGETMVRVTLGDKIIKVNHDQEVTMDTVAEIKDKRTFIPARFIAEALNAKVYWDGERQTVVILTEEYIRDHPAMYYGMIADIDNPWLAEVFYEKFKSNYTVKGYGSAERIRERITGALKLAEKMKVTQDDENERFVLIIPEYDTKDFRISVIGPSTGNVDKPGTYYAYYKDANPNNGGLFSFEIIDPWEGNTIVYSIMGYKKGDSFVHGAGTHYYYDFVGARK